MSTLDNRYAAWAQGVCRSVSFALFAGAAPGAFAQDVGSQAPVPGAAIAATAAERPEPTEALWSYGGPRALFSALDVHDGVLVAIENRTGLHALDAETGKVLWRYVQLAKYSVAHGVTMTRGEGLENGLEKGLEKGFDVALIGGDEGAMAIERKTGRVRWKRRFAFGASELAVAGGRAFTASADGKFHALDLKTGESLWSYDFLADKPKDPPGWSGARVRFGGLEVFPRIPSVDRTSVYLPIFDQARVLALDLATGERRWSFQAAAGIYGKVATGRRDVYVGSHDGHTYALCKKSGERSWAFDTKARCEAGALVTDRVVYVASSDGKLRALDRLLASPIWTHQPDGAPGQERAIYHAPILHGDVVVLASFGGQLYGVDRKSGARAWKIEVGAQIQGVVVEGKRIFVTTQRRPGARVAGGGDCGLLAFDIPAAHASVVRPASDARRR